MPELMTCYAYIDGQYVREELRNAGMPDEFDPRKPADFARRKQYTEMRVTVTRVFYYDALDEGAERAEQDRQSAYFDRLRRLPDTHVILGQVRRSSSARRREQKGVDVQLAVDALRAATSGVVKGIVLVTGDADFVPLVKGIREAGPHVFVFAFARSLSSELELEADRVWKWEQPPTDWALPPS
jgi:uncharacterized LabA/DUF88 family protein